MFNLRLCNEATIRYSLLKFGCMHLCGKGYKYFSPHCCKCNSFGCIAAIRCGNACHGPHSDSVYSGSEHRQFNSPRLVKREAGFPWPRRVLIGSNQVWRVNDSPYYREYMYHSQGLRPQARCTWHTSWGLGTMSLFSAQILTHLPLDKMGAMLFRKRSFQMHFREWFFFLVFW